ncbi:PH domain-containing protein [Granulicoccus phenolivorans]|uniref:PH domain-containing protein n=1 Tax=Granulicoccus phenolivorans TaxID=266854 RepID=UPI000478F138|nr:PH domain-containing protein [Granulicoccus phenolivorans]
MTGPNVVSDPILTYHPRKLLWWALGFTAVLVAASLFGWAMLPGQIQSQFSWIQVLTLIGFIAIMAGIMLGLGFSHVRADRTGMTFRNGLFRRTLTWGEVRGIGYGPNDPWAYVYLNGDDPTSEDPQRYMLLALQRVDGQRTLEGVRDLQSLRRESLGL